MPGVSFQNGMYSNTEVQNPPTQTLSLDEPSHQSDYEEAHMPPAPRRSTRNKSPSLKKAITIYEEAVKAIQRELAEFEAQK